MDWSRSLRIGGTACSMVLFGILLPMPGTPKAKNFKAAEIGATRGEQITAYVEPMRSVSRLKINHSLRAEATAVRKAAAFWLAEWRAGKLNDLPIVPDDEGTRDGIKLQILDGRRTLVCALANVARDALSRGDRHQAGIDFANAFSLCEILKYSDFVSLPASTASQNLLLDEVRIAGLRSSKSVVAAVAERKDWHTTAKRVAAMLTEYEASQALSSESNRRIRQPILELSHRVQRMAPIALQVGDLSDEINHMPEIRADHRMLVRMSLRRLIDLEYRANGISPTDWLGGSNQRIVAFNY